MRRLPAGGRIDRSRPLAFQFNGQALTGFAGDTLASALLANAVRVVGRSVERGRPRGVYAAGAEEPNAYVQLEIDGSSEPMLRATQVELFDGLVASATNGKGSVPDGADPRRYDKMFAHQSTLLDHTARVAYIQKMQQFIYDQIPEIVLNYPNYLQAYRSDRFTGWKPEPTNGGTYLFGWGNQYQGLQPLAAAESGSSSGMPTVLWVVLGLVAIAVIAFVALSRRRRAEEEA